MPFARKEYDIRLIDKWTGKHLTVAGTYQVMTRGGSATEQTIYANDNATTAGSNPGTISSGQIRFFMDDSVADVDIIIYTANGDAEYIQAVNPDENHSVEIDTHRREQLLHIPLVFNNNSETTTGFTLVGPVNVVDIDLFITTVDANETVDVGLDGSTTNDPNGFIAAASVATAGYVELGGVINDGSPDYFNGITYGALLASVLNGAEGANTVGGVVRHKSYIAESETDANITVTGSAGSDTFYGWCILHLMKLPT